MVQTKKDAPRATIRNVNDALAARGYEATLVKGGDYFFFRGGEANGWLDRTIRVPRVGDLTVDEWVRAYQDLKKKNAEIERAGRRKRR
jgi:hypothetical protein